MAVQEFELFPVVATYQVVAVSTVTSSDDEAPVIVSVAIGISVTTAVSVRGSGVSVGEGVTVGITSCAMLPDSAEAAVHAVSI